MVSMKLGNAGGGTGRSLKGGEAATAEQGDCPMGRVVRSHQYFGYVATVQRSLTVASRIIPANSGGTDH